MSKQYYEGNDVYDILKNAAGVGIKIFKYVEKIDGLKGITFGDICNLTGMNIQTLMNDVAYYMNKFTSNISLLDVENYKGPGSFEIDTCAKCLALVTYQYMRIYDSYDIQFITQKSSPGQALDNMCYLVDKLSSEYECRAIKTGVNYLKIGMYFGISAFKAYNIFSLHNELSIDCYPDNMGVNVSLRGKHYDNLKDVSAVTGLSIEMIGAIYKYRVDKYNKVTKPRGKVYSNDIELKLDYVIEDKLKMYFNVVGYTKETGPFLLMKKSDYEEIPSGLLDRLDWLDTRTYSYFDDKTGSCYMLVDKLKMPTTHNKIKFIPYVGADKPIETTKLSDIIEKAEEYGLKQYEMRFALLAYLRYNKGYLGNTNNEIVIRLDKALELYSSKRLVKGKLYRELKDLPISDYNKAVIDSIRINDLFGLEPAYTDKLGSQIVFICGDESISKLYNSKTPCIEKINYINLNASKHLIKIIYKKMAIDITQDDYNIAQNVLKKVIIPSSDKEKLRKLVNRAINKENKKREELCKQAEAQEELRIKEEADRRARDAAEEKRRQEERERRQVEYRKKQAKYKKIANERGLYETIYKPLTHEEKVARYAAKMSTKEPIIVKGKVYGSIEEALKLYGITRVHKSILKVPNISKSAFVCFHIAEKNGLASYKELSKLTDAEKVIYINNCIQLVSKL